MKKTLIKSDTDQALQKSNIHQQWEKTYQTDSNHIFFNYVFDYLDKKIRKAKGNAKVVVLDAGCGTGGHSVSLLDREYSVTAIDLSEYVIKNTSSRLKRHKKHHNITFKQDDITKLTFDDNSFDCVLCWGVLMHVPDIEKAISELSRVLKPEGILIVGEANMHSLQSIIKRCFNLIFKQKNTDINKTPFGIEKWQASPQGGLLTRQSNINHLKKELGNNNLIVEDHVAGQFTELFIKFSNKRVQTAIHFFNRIWFLYVKSPRLAFGNLILSRKKS